MDIRWGKFIWNYAKAQEVFKSRGITFKEAAQAFDDPIAVYGTDEINSKQEHRQWVIGISPKKRLLLVIYTEREDDLTRIITTWKATQEDKELYEKTIR